MGARSEALAKQFEAKVQEATAVIEKLSDADWRKTTEGEKWSVAVTAHHVAQSHAGIAGLLKAVAAGQPVGLTVDALHEMNAKHAQDHASCTKEETLALHRKGAAEAAATVRGFSDEQLAKTGTVLSGLPPMTVEQVVTNILIHHIEDHVGSIKKAVAR